MVRDGAEEAPPRREVPVWSRPDGRLRPVLSSNHPKAHGCGSCLSGHFQADLSVSQRWPLNALASASTDALSSFWSPSSSLLGASARLSFAPALSSAVVMAGLLIHSIRWSEPPGLSAAASAVTSMVSVSSSAGTIWLGRFNVSFSLPVSLLHFD